MTGLQSLLRAFGSVFQWWYTVAPWEDSVRVRAGKHVRSLGPGIHLRVPYVDRVYRQSVRLRMVNVVDQTLTTKDGKTLVLKAVVGYEIADILKLYERLHDAEDAVRDIVATEIVDYVSSHDSGFAVRDMMRGVISSVGLGRFGVRVVRMQLTDFAYVRTYRIITGEAGRRWNHGAGLETLEDIRAASE